MHSFKQVKPELRNGHMLHKRTSLLCHKLQPLSVQQQPPLPARRAAPQQQESNAPAAAAPAASECGRKVAGASTDLRIIYARLGQLAMPYWTDPEAGASARWRLAGVVGLTLATTGVSVVFNFLGRDFFNALSEKNEELFTLQLVKYLGAFVLGIPVFVLKSYYQSKLALEWRNWLTGKLMDDYFAARTFYSLQAQATVDNPDQRIASDVDAFTGTALNLTLVLLNATIDLVSFSGILYSIYPPLFGALLAYSVSGTLISLWLGKPLVGLNFAQEAREADLRYGLVRVRENAEAVAFYRGEEDEKTLLKARLQAAVSNYLGLLVASRNLDFFTSFYRFLIQLLPAAVVAPLFFQGKIEFGVINQSQSAFNHVLNDMSLVVYQFESLAGFSAVIDRLGQFTEAMSNAKQLPQAVATGSENIKPEAAAATTAATTLGAAQTNTVPETHTSSSPASLVSHVSSSSSSKNGHVDSLQQGTVQVEYMGAAGNNNGAAGLQHSTSQHSMLQLQSLTVVTPDGSSLLVRDLDLTIPTGGSLLVMGPSGAGKTSLLRTLAGLWVRGEGRVLLACDPAQAMFLPQKPYMVLGSLRDQLLYPTFQVEADKATQAVIAAESGDMTLATRTAAANSSNSTASSPASAAEDTSIGSSTSYVKLPPPNDEALVQALRTVRLGHLLSRYAPAGGGSALDAQVDWASSLSIGEQQRVAWARLLLAKPKLALLDEATSALDQSTEEELYQVLSKSGITFVSVGHRSTLKKFHSQLLQLMPAQPLLPEKEAPANGSNQTANVTWQLMPASNAAALKSM